jgi:hypothetical protein
MTRPALAHGGRVHSPGEAATDAGEDHSCIDTSVPHSARVWNHWLGGKDNYPVDRDASDQFQSTYPQIAQIARYSRLFLGRAVRALAAGAGIRQFLDIGVGLPCHDNLHEIAQRAAPDARIVYVDNDPLVITHACALLTSGPKGAVDVVAADLNDPRLILQEAAAALRLDEPVALVLANVLGHVTSQDQARRIAHELMAGLCPGSHLVVCDRTGTSPTHRQAQELYNATGARPYLLRTPEQFTELVAGVDLAEPGVVSPAQWRPEVEPFDLPGHLDALCAVGGKP